MVKTYQEAVDVATDHAKPVRKGEEPDREPSSGGGKASKTVAELIEEYVEQPKMKAEKGDRYKEWARTTNLFADIYVLPMLGTRSPGL